VAAVFTLRPLLVVRLLTPVLVNVIAPVDALTPRPALPTKLVTPVLAIIIVSELEFTVSLIAEPSSKLIESLKELATTDVLPFTLTSLKKGFSGFMISSPPTVVPLGRSMVNPSEVI
jgi:hypothetical protein